VTWLLFASGVVGGTGLGVGIASWMRVREDGDPLAPGTRLSQARGCLCSRRRNWGGVREALTGRAVLTVGCPVLAHHPAARERMYSGE
jgi:hypothetical protein